MEEKLNIKNELLNLWMNDLQRCSENFGEDDYLRLLKN
jgi:hypothetical protein